MRFPWQVRPSKSPQHRLIFCINSGRSGSQFLSVLLGTAQHVSSHHEAHPAMIESYLQMVNQQPYAASFEARRIKCTAIQAQLAQLPPEGIYCETNHMFIKTFFDVVLHDFKTVEVILLRRELALVLKSFIDLSYFSPENTVWHHWMSSPNAVTAALKPIGTDEEMDQYDRCIAYLFDIEARALRFQKEYPHIKIHEIRLESLKHDDQVQQFFRALNLTPTAATHEVYSQVVNDRTERKKVFQKNADLQYCRMRIEQYIEKARALDIPIPATLALKPL